MADLTQFYAGIAAARAASNNDYADPRTTFLAEMNAVGLYPPMGIVEGKLQRFALPQEKGGKKSGWYSFHTFPDSKDASKYIGTGSYGSWKGDPECVKWTSRNPSAMTFQDRAQYNQQIEAAKAARDAEQLIVYTEASKEAEIIWQASLPVSEHPYLTKKSIKGIEIREGRGNLIIPVKYQGHIQSLQFIWPDGTKRFLSGGKTKGGWHVIIGKSDTVCIVEGYATGVSVHEATGATVYIAFSAGNLYEVSTYVKTIHAQARIIICGDADDVGKAKAIQAAEALSIEAIFPTVGTDMNDMACAGGNVKELIEKRPVEAYEKKKGTVNNLAPKCGFLLDCYNFYNVSSGNDQKGFAIQTALAVTSTILARSYKSNFEHYPSLYLLNIGKSGTGKEAGKKIAEDLLEATGNGRLIAGDGYTSSGAVMSALLDRPKHYSAIDEFGRYMAAANGNKNHNQIEANTAIMELFGRCGGVLRPKNYSSMSVSKDVAAQLKDRYVCAPSLTLMASTTPNTFFDNIGIESVRSGFINRFLISFSDAEREIYEFKEPVAVPQSIINWAKQIEDRSPVTHIASEDPEFTVIHFTADAAAACKAYQRYCIDTMKALEKSKMEELAARSAEIAFRIALIHALSRDPTTKTIELDDVEWSIAYAKDCLQKTTEQMKLCISGSEHESDKKEILQALRDTSPEWVRFSNMIKQPPYSKHKKRDLQIILDSLVEAGLVDDRSSTGVGRQTREYCALK